MRSRQLDRRIVIVRATQHLCRTCAATESTKRRGRRSPWYVAKFRNKATDLDPSYIAALREMSRQLEAARAEFLAHNALR
jgi:hypothetical protein